MSASSPPGRDGDDEARGGLAPAPVLAPAPAPSPALAPAPKDPPALDAHFVFLVHGFLGHPDELSYVEEAIGLAAAEAEGEDGTDADDGAAVADAGDGAEATGDRSGGGGDDRRDDGVEVVVRRVACNAGKTRDGVRAGGERLAEEVRTFVRGYGAKDSTNNREEKSGRRRFFRAGLSFVGYSLGGVYARYAISVLPLEFDLESSGREVQVVLVPRSFCTVAAPHLGMASHAYLFLPRRLERVLGRTLGKTGGDLFRCGRGKGGAPPGDLMYRMATEASFLDPLSAYRRRITYANAFGTDVMVPAATAGMLSSRSDSPHHLSGECDRWDPEEVGLDVLAFETRPSERPEGAPSPGTESRTQSRKKDEALAMSRSLDSLGWTKVFVDCREGMPGPFVRCPCRRKRKDWVESVVDRKRSEAEARSKEGGEEPPGVVLESKELWSLTRKSEHWHLAPNGHFVIVAHSKTKRGAKRSAKGRPLVRRVAADLVHHVRSCDIGEGS